MFLEMIAIINLNLFIIMKKINIYNNYYIIIDITINIIYLHLIINLFNNRIENFISRKLFLLFFLSFI